MQRSNQFSAHTRAALVAIVALSGVVMAGCAEAPVPNQPVVAGVWQHRQANFTYYGLTSLYSCDGLESNIRGLLLHLGARQDATVTARGCPHGSSVPGRVAIVDTDFYTLASAGSRTPDAVQARWTPLEVNPQRPAFISDGDCELIQQMKDLISRNFSLRDLEYRTNCVPHTINVDGFLIRAQALKPVAPPTSGASS